MSERFETHARTVSLLTLVSRLSGLVRDASLSRIFGAGGVMDAFFFAFMIPNLFRRLFGEGALAAAFLPVYAKLEGENGERGRQLASLMIGRLAIVLGSVVLVGEAILFFISKSGGHGNLAVWLMMIMLPYMPLVCLVAILGAMLQVHKRFGPTAAAPIVLNVCIIGAAWGYYFSWFWRGDTSAIEEHIGVGGVAGAVVFAGVVQVGWSLWALRRQKWWTKERGAAREPFRGVMGQAGPMILGLGVLQINTMLDGLIAGYPTIVGGTIFGFEYPLQEGAMAAVSFAQRLYQFPLGVFGIAVATAIFPALARQAEDGEGFTATLRRGLRLVMFIGLPASIGLWLVREPLTRVILQGGEFGVEQVGRVSWVLMGYAPAIWAYSMSHVLTRAFYAKGDAKTPVKVAMGIVGLNLVLNCTLIWTPLREAGLAWSTAVCAVVQVLALLWLVRRHAAGLVDGEVRKSWLKSGGAGVLMGGMVLLVGWLLFADTSDSSWGGSAGELGVLVGTGGVVMGLGALALGMEELKWAIGKR